MKKTALLLFLLISATIDAQECVERIVVGRFATTAFTTERKYSWGSNENGEVGNGTSEVQSTALPTVMGDSWIDISHRFQHTLALNENGTIWAWGANELGQLGDGTTETRLSPVQIGTDTDWVAISAGRLHSLALKSDGTLWGWGNNNAYELTDSNTTFFTTPILLNTDSDWAAIEASHFRTFGIKTNGTLWVRGGANNGALGLGPFYYFVVDSMLQVGTDTTWAEIIGGENFTMGLKTDSTLWSWGKGLSIGQGNVNDLLIPAQVGDDRWTAIAAGQVNSLGVKEDGTLWEWGEGFWYGEGLYPNRLSPVQVGDDNDWKGVGVAYFHFMALKENKTLWSWGYNDGGYGDGTTVDMGIPTLVIACETLSTDDADLVSTSFYPNPVKDYLTYKSSKVFSSFRITNMLGQTVKKGSIKETKIDLSELNPGMYLIILQTAEGDRVSSKFLKM